MLIVVSSEGNACLEPDHTDRHAPTQDEIS